jgi:hypothetical protein
MVYLWNRISFTTNNLTIHTINMDLPHEKNTLNSYHYYSIDWPHSP